MKEKEMPAFPSCGADGYGPSGMSLRDYFAAKAMEGDWAAQNETCGEFKADGPEDVIHKRAKLYFRMADAMLAERSK